MSKYVFAALLAFFSAQAGVPSALVAPAAEIVWCTEAKKQAPREVALVRPAATPVPRPTPSYLSRTAPEPDSAVLFQRPPPAFSSFS
ncbi:MAG: hypothetical protein ACM336_01145 [Acidobacteriota bacterium]